MKERGGRCPRPLYSWSSMSILRGDDIVELGVDDSLDRSLSVIKSPGQRLFARRKKATNCIAACIVRDGSREQLTESGEQ